MSKIVITGSASFIGRELERAAVTSGHEVVGLSRSGAGRSIRWSLGDDLPVACEDADAVVHLASATLVETKEPDAAAAIDVRGTERIIEQVRGLRRAGRRIRFVFLSSQSARMGATNSYGRSKWRIEELLQQPDEIVVRPGLVYSDQPASVFAMIDRLSRLPVVPIVSSKPGIQPIHVTELARAIVQLIELPDPPKLALLGSSAPLTFQQTITSAAQRAGRRPPFTVRVPLVPVRLATRMLDGALRTRLTERLDGLTGLHPMDTAPTLERLQCRIAPFDRSNTAPSEGIE